MTREQRACVVVTLGRRPADLYALLETLLQDPKVAVLAVVGDPTDIRAQEDLQTLSPRLLLVPTNSTERNAALNSIALQSRDRGCNILITFSTDTVDSRSAPITRLLSAMQHSEASCVAAWQQSRGARTGPVGKIWSAAGRWLQTAYLDRTKAMKPVHAIAVDLPTFCALGGVKSDREGGGAHDLLHRLRAENHETWNTEIPVRGRKSRKRAHGAHGMEATARFPQSLLLTLYAALALGMWWAFGHLLFSVAFLAMAACCHRWSRSGWLRAGIRGLAVFAHIISPNARERR